MTSAASRIDSEPLLVAIGRVDGNRGLVCGVAEDVIATRIDVGLITGEYAELRDDPRRGLDFPRRRRRHILGRFQWLLQGQLADWGQCLTRHGGKRKQ